MNYLVFLQAGELEKILSGIKSMILQVYDPLQNYQQSVRPGDDLYFLRDKDEGSLRVKATVCQVLPVVNGLEEDLARTLKEMQPRLQLTEDQYNFWANQHQVVLVEFKAAHKIDLIRVARSKTTNSSGWIAFETFDQIN